MPTLDIDEFTGLDLRRLPSRSSPKTSRVATNLSFTLGKGIETRPGSRTVAVADANSKGLLATKSGLFAVAPAGQSISSNNAALRYLYIGGDSGGAFTQPLGYLQEVTDYELYEAPGGQASYPYVVIKNSSGGIEHHYVDVTPPDSTTPVQTYVSLPFTPSEGLLKLGSRLIAPDNLGGALWFNSILYGARNWTLPEDAGNIPVAKAAPQSRDIIGLSYFRQFAAVMFEDSCQLWAFDENPDNITRVENFGGIGTRYRRGLANVLGDLFYLSIGGFRRLASAAVTGEREEINLGAPIRVLFDELIATGETPVGKFIASRSQYWCAFGGRVAVITFNPASDSKERVQAWAEWEYPFEITDIVESEGKVYVRTTDDEIKELSEEYGDDDGAPISFSCKTQFLASRAKAFAINWQELSVGMSGTAEIRVYYDERDPDAYFSLGRWSGATSAFQSLILDVVSNSVALGFTGTGRWQLDAITLGYQPVRA